MIDLRLWRFGLLAVPLAAIIAMFSLQDVPSPLSQGIPPDAFDGTTAERLARAALVAAPGFEAASVLADVLFGRGEVAVRPGSRRM